MSAAVRIEVENLIPDRRMEKRATEARDGLRVPVAAIEEVLVYRVRADGEIAPDVFADPVLQQAHTENVKYRHRHGDPSFVVEVSFRPGVTDNPGKAAAEALALVGAKAQVASGALYFLFGNLNAEHAERLASELLANDLIQKAEVHAASDFYAQDRFASVSLPEVVLPAGAAVERISLERSDAALEELSRARCLALTAEELRHVREAFRPKVTDVELEIIAQSWSEHCKHKIFAADIEYRGPGGEEARIQSLYKTYVKRATRDVEAARGLDWLVSVFSDNAGVVRFDDQMDVCIKVETHNTPSALDPYGGALTGILGVNRDILGVGMGARPIANMDVFCFAPPDMPKPGEEQFMPQGPKSPRRILEGVHKGVEDGGNKSGIPTVNGAFFFDRDYAGKPLVFVGTVGVLPRNLPDGRSASRGKVSVGDRVVMIGGAIGADGIHGATFSSLELDENSPATAVQIGDPITQKRFSDFLLEARDLGLYSAVTDNGAGGLSSSVGEMSQATGGARIDLSMCPVKYAGLRPWELMVSESQERMTVAVPPDRLPGFLELASRRGVAATDIGAFTADGNLDVFYGAERVASLPLSFLHGSLPAMQLKAEWKAPLPRREWSDTTTFRFETPKDKSLKGMLLHLLASPNITSKEKWIRAYDHEVQAATAIKPFSGEGPSDAALVWLHPHGGTEGGAVAVGCGLAPRISLHDPYLMAQFAVDEAVRNVVVAGGDPDACCLLDNFCWPDPVASPKNPEGEYRLGQLVRACRGLYDACVAYGMPLVSGKDSMKNDFRGKDKRGETIAIGVLPTLLVTSMAKAKMGRAPGSDFKNAGDLIYAIGEGDSALGGSEYAHALGMEAACPRISFSANLENYRKIHRHMNLFSSLHDVSEGGLLVAIAESMIGRGFGAKLPGDVDAGRAFGEAPGRIVVSVSPGARGQMKALFGAEPIGEVTSEKRLAWDGGSVALEELAAAWKKGF